MKRLLVALLLVPAPATFAQSTEEIVDEAGVKRAVKYREREEVEFDRGLDLEGELVKPQIGLIGSQTRPAFNPLVRLRVDWNEELRQSVDAVR